jgi:hypothetical protein
MFAGAEAAHVSGLFIIAAELIIDSIRESNFPSSVRIFVITVFVVIQFLIH